MLTQIHIRNLATIEELQLNLHNGNTMITGETGAGKSIFIEAIELALGGRSRIEMIRGGKEQAEISLCFDISQLTPAQKWLINHDFYEENECIIRRVLIQDGRTRNYINGIPTTLQLIREFSEHLFHLHGQHEQQVLLKAENQREILDRYAEHLSLVDEIKKIVQAWKLLENEIQMLRKKIAISEQQREYLLFQLDELSALNLHENEWDSLECEHRKLAHSEELIAHTQQILENLTENEQHSIHSYLNKIRKSLESMQIIDTKINSWVNLLDAASIQLNDLEVELHHYLESSELEPGRLNQLEQRISQILEIARKHKTQPNELMILHKKLQSELNAIQTSGEELEQLETKQVTLTESYHQLAAKLSHDRQHAAIQLSHEISTTIRLLSLPYGECHIALEKYSVLKNTDLSPHGYEKIIFLIKTNPDQPLQPLNKVISGGELSRLSLAVHLALAHQTITPTLIFDEVDTGVGGATAEKIGKLLRKLGETYQVFCVTHLAQVAACGHHHLLVEKRIAEQSTYTRLRLLDDREKQQEIARMLAGEKITETTLKHAQEILQNV
ncbi:MAG: DNA repair protein RecN [Gammaproteobacteria bacterium RIFCSPHIGHO2_12_FULL_37_14]|nr:MAG: DNA repair protein RecN [Gammaproteobacteria bacterium RIFCSPHIGHO2_12_FULL_37_14]